MTAATRAMELASFALIAIFGAWLLVRKLLSLRRAPAPALSDPGPATGLRFQAVEVTGHDHAGSGAYCETCGHAHAPDPRLLGGRRFRLQEAWSAIVAVGLRPCSGAILVM